MKGIIFSLLEDVVVRHHGEAAWEALLDGAGLTGSYTSLGSYPDDHVVRLVRAAASAFGLTPEAVLRWFGEAAMPVLAERHPGFFEAHTNTRPFLISLNSVIHPEVRKIYPGADVPNFDFEDAPGGALLMSYHSLRRLCALAEGFVAGAAGYYGETMRLEHVTCMHRGDGKCQFRIAFASGSGS